VDHWIYQDAEYFKVWFEMLFRARYSTEPVTKLVYGQLITLNRGEFIFGRQSWSERLGISEQRLRTLIKRLVQDNMIELVKRYNKFTIYKVVNYEKYNPQGDQHEILENQYLEGNNNQQNNQQSTTKQPSTNHQLTTKEESNKDKKDNKDNKVNNIYTPIINYLNEKANKNFKPSTKKTQSLINARIKEGFTLDDFKKVIDIKCSQWLGTEMEKYLRPETLFGTKFEGYLNEKMKQTRDIKEGNIPNYGW
jgi:uncharacterized phage protein (TIGR02220 family)